MLCLLLDMLKFFLQVASLSFLDFLSLNLNGAEMHVSQPDAMMRGL
jgi:hypothetical protein